MTKIELLAVVAEKYDALQALNNIDNFYEYEKGFEDIWKETGRAILEKNISEPSADWRKKKHLQSLGISK